MQEYNTESRWGKHLVKITLMDGDHKGHVTVRIGGNCMGRSVLDAAVEALDNPQTFADCDCSLHCRDEDVFEMVLMNDDGDEMELMVDDRELDNMIVSVEIVDYTPRE